MVYRTYAIACNACCMRCLHERRNAHRNLTATTGMHACICTYIYACVCAHAWVRRHAIYVHTRMHTSSPPRIHIGTHMRTGCYAYDHAGGMQTCMFTYAWPSYLHTYCVCSTSLRRSQRQPLPSARRPSARPANNMHQRGVIVDGRACVRACMHVCCACVAYEGLGRLLARLRGHVRQS